MSLTHCVVAVFIMLPKGVMYGIRGGMDILMMSVQTYRGHITPSINIQQIELLNLQFEKKYNQRQLTEFLLKYLYVEKVGRYSINC